MGAGLSKRVCSTAHCNSQAIHARRHPIDRPPSRIMPRTPPSLPQRSIAGWVGEQFSGVTYLDFIRELARRVESDWDAVRGDLESIRSALLQRRGALVNLTADAATLESSAAHVSGLLAALPEQVAGAAGPAWAPVLVGRNEALTVPTQVNYVGKAVNLYEDAGYKARRAGCKAWCMHGGAGG